MPMSQVPECFYRVSVKALVLNETRDKFLVCKEDNGYWELPGGGLDWGTTPQEDLPREIDEEMGLKTTWIADNPSYFLTSQQGLNPDINIVNVLYECTLESLDFTPSSECIEIKFVDKSDIEGMQVFVGVKKLSDMFDSVNHNSPS
jgi:ADP-ribose pyrophosphatase YjhB (NUDIX family)